MKIIDLHCDTIMHFWMGKKLSEMQDAHISLAKLKAGNVGLQCFAIFVPTGSAAERLEGYTTPEAYFDLAYERFLEETGANSDEIRRSSQSVTLKKTCSGTASAQCSPSKTVCCLTETSKYWMTITGRVFV